MVSERDSEPMAVCRVLHTGETVIAWDYHTDDVLGVLTVLPAHNRHNLNYHVFLWHANDDRTDNTWHVDYLPACQAYNDLVGVWGK